MHQWSWNLKLFLVAGLWSCVEFSALISSPPAKLFTVNILFTQWSGEGPHKSSKHQVDSWFRHHMGCFERVGFGSWISNSEHNHLHCKPCRSVSCPECIFIQLSCSSNISDSVVFSCQSEVLMLLFSQSYWALPACLLFPPSTFLEGFPKHPGRTPLSHLPSPFQTPASSGFLLPACRDDSFCHPNVNMKLFELPPWQDLQPQHDSADHMTQFLVFYLDLIVFQVLFMNSNTLTNNNHQMQPCSCDSALKQRFIQAVYETNTC